MSRYFTRPKATVRSFWVEDDCDNYSSQGVPDVPEHVATPTGLLDANGDEIWRAPPPIGFQFWEEG